MGGFDLSHRADCCVYLVEAGDELVMIDSGAGPSLDRIIENVSKLGLDPDRINHVIATHCHIDHIRRPCKAKRALRRPDCGS